MNFDVIIIGGGHAGCEAAAASARMGAQTNLDIAQALTKGQLGKRHAQKLIQMRKCLGGIARRVAADTTTKRMQR